MKFLDLKSTKYHQDYGRIGPSCFKQALTVNGFNGLNDLKQGLRSLDPGIKGLALGIRDLNPDIRSLDPDIRGLDPDIRGLNLVIRGLKDQTNDKSQRFEELQDCLGLGCPRA